MSVEDTVKIMLQDVQIGDYANAIHNHCKKLHYDFVGDDTACKNCILSVPDEFGAYTVCGIFGKEPQDWDVIL